MDQFIAFYPSDDLEACKKFYQEILGLELARDQGTCLIFKVSQDGYVGFCNHLEAITDPAFIITLVTNQVDACFEKMQKHKVVMEEAPRLNEKYQIYHYFARDPNGYRVEVQQFLEPL